MTILLLVNTDSFQNQTSCAKMASVQCLLALVTFLLTADLFAAQATTLPLFYPPTSRQGDGSTCPLDGAVVDETREGIRTAIRQSILPGYCGGSFGWRRVAFLNMSDPTEECPSPLMEYSSTRVCGREESSGPGCSSVSYTNSGGQYNYVCGRIIGYAFDSPDAFRGGDIDSTYADGVSVTHGQPRQHIWSFVAGLDEDNSANAGENCPCDNPANEQQVPSFVGNNYFCETGNPGVWSGRTATLFTDDPLWDAEGCGPNSECCSFNSPPWFTAQLPSPTSDGIEVRICGSDAGGTAHEDTPIELIELYVK